MDRQLGTPIRETKHTGTENTTGRFVSTTTLLIGTTDSGMENKGQEIPLAVSFLSFTVRFVRIGGLIQSILQSHGKDVQLGRRTTSVGAGVVHETGEPERQIDTIRIRWQRFQDHPEVIHSGFQLPPQSVE